MVTHHCRKLWGDTYEITWYPGSRLRFTQGMGRITDEAGARRYCEKWDIDFDAVLTRYENATK